MLANLSQDGCCLELMHIPSEDVVLVQWSRFEVFGSIVWRELGRLGVRFDETIPYDWVLETRELDSSSAPISAVQDAKETAKAWAEGKRIV